METSAIAAAGTTTAAKPRGAADALTGEDFFRLLVAQLSNQDPLEPTSNQELLAQLASIRDIELSSTLTDSLKSLTSQQRYVSAAGLIGQFVTGAPAEDNPSGLVPQGLVVGVRFASDGQAMLELDNGMELPLERIETVAAADRAAQTLVGKLVSGVDTSDPQESKALQGVVTAVRREDDGTMTLELDTGDILPLANVVSVAEANGAEVM